MKKVYKKYQVLSTKYEIFILLEKYYSTSSAKKVIKANNIKANIYTFLILMETDIGVVRHCKATYTNRLKFKTEY